MANVHLMVTEGGTPREMTDADGLAGGSARARVFTLQAPVAQDLTGIVASGLAGDSTADSFAPSGQPDMPRNLQVTFDAAWDGGDVTVYGKDQFDQFVSETFASNPGNTVVGSKVFKSVSSIIKSAVGASSTEATVGVGKAFGFKGRAVNTDALLYANNVAEAGALDITNNSITPTTDPDGAVSFGLVVNV